MLRHWFTRHGWGVTVGGVLTLAAVALHVSGVTERLEIQGFDYHVRHYSRIPASDDILHIDIGDDALDRVGSWPWPRDYQADLVRVLDDLGARRIVMDIVFSEPRPAEVRLPTLDRYADLEGEIEQIGEVSQENFVFPDDELADAVRRAGSVWLSMFYDDPSVRVTISPLQNRLTEALEENIEQTAQELAERLGEELERIEAVLAGVKRRVIQNKVNAYLDAHPAEGAQETHEAILSSSFERQSADRADLLAGYHRALSLRELRRACAVIPETLQGRLPKVGEVIPPIYKLTAGAEGVGFVTFRPDRDGRTRHIPLLMDWDGRLLEQLGFAVARKEQGIELDDLAMDERGNLLIRGRQGHPARRIQLTNDGQALINWHVAEEGKWQNCFHHLPVTQLLQIRDGRQRMRENNIRRDYAVARALFLVKKPDGFDLYRERVNRMLALRRRVHWAQLQGRPDTEEIREAQAEAEELARRVAAEESATMDFIREMWAALQEEPDRSDPEIQEAYDRFGQAYRLINQRVPELEALNAGIALQEERQLARLRPLVQDKVCFVGYTATAVADMVTTPAYEHMPGVLVHSNLYNSMMQGRFRSWSSQKLQIGVMILFGMFVTLGTVYRGPRESLVMLLIIAGLTWVLSTQVSFARHDFWVGLLLAVILTFVVWAMIVLVRYLVTDRQRRRFSKAVAQYVSPAMARRIADETEHLDLAPREADVTCFFSDLAGFTRISERLGPEGTKTVLNPYLEHMSDVLHRHNALINKFMGDGIFAFFNPPILPCQNHALAACESALDSRAALDEMVKRYAQHPLAEHFRLLSMRIGIASGRVFVGDYGSENKLDYTCVGDTVNLAARLESANKQFDSGLMISQSTRQAAGDRYELRHLGALQVKGQTVAVHVYELLGRRGEVAGEEMAFAETFTQAVAAFARREWDLAMGRFEECLGLRPRDAGVMRYLQVIPQYRAQPPADHWQGGLELTEK